MSNIEPPDTQTKAESNFGYVAESQVVNVFATWVALIEQSLIPVRDKQGSLQIAQPPELIIFEPYPRELEPYLYSYQAQDYDWLRNARPLIYDEFD